MELEDRLTVPSAEGIDLHLVLAGIGSRSLALVVDLVLQALLILVLGVLAATFGDVGAAGASVATFLVLLGYPILFEVFNGGRTLGKAWLGIAVVDLDGSPVRFLPSVIRNVVRFVDALPGTYLVGLIAILATSRSQRVGDLAAGTLVVRRPRTTAVVPHLAWAPTAGGTAPPSVDLAAAGWDLTAVTVDELAAIRAFLGRRGELAPLARGQIASTLAGQILPKVAGVPLDGGPEAFLERVAAAKTAR